MCGMLILGELSKVKTNTSQDNWALQHLTKLSPFVISKKINYLSTFIPTLKLQGFKIILILIIFAFKPTDCISLQLFIEDDSVGP